MIVTASVPARVREGMLLLSGDVLLLFNPLQIDYSGNGAVREFIEWVVHDRIDIAPLNS